MGELSPESDVELNELAQNNRPRSLNLDISMSHRLSWRGDHCSSMQNNLLIASKCDSLKRVPWGRTQTAKIKFQGMYVSMHSVILYVRVRLAHGLRSSTKYRKFDRICAVYCQLPCARSGWHHGPSYRIQQVVQVVYICTMFY